MTFELIYLMGFDIGGLYSKLSRLSSRSVIESPLNSSGSEIHISVTKASKLLQHNRNEEEIELTIYIFESSHEYDRYRLLACSILLRYASPARIA